MKNIVLILVTLIMSTVVYANEKSLYNFSWLDNDKEIYVLQNRKFRKVGNVYVGATAAYNLSQDFLDAYGGTIRGGYFFTEDWGVELIYGKNTNSENDTAKGVKEQGTVPFYRQIDSFMGAMLMWSPFYSKINTFNRIFYFDWMFGFGVGTITTKDNRNKFDTAAANTNALTDESQTGALWNTGFRFYINEHWSLRLDLTGQTYKADKTKKAGTGPTSTTSKLYNNYDLGLGLNYAF
ncbi:outer membrane beta-barrel domain-containing protein [Peredibacter starrii]|uniref:Outer membrane beta-barrel domain-containing protein n=1 Tax=Peredibacter starrii TaxID=28202 RepID=A0AAX4HQY1_9BACT|nr:outer membrane beta-barrel domain-containing protein [Peredibacter starrii]WPU65740.1 outer membrane beta-barrel domain-containing protein [Peredibacter starrii]